MFNASKHQTVGGPGVGIECLVLQRAFTTRCSFGRHGSDVVRGRLVMSCCRRCGRRKAVHLYDGHVRLGAVKLPLLALFHPRPLRNDTFSWPAPPSQSVKSADLATPFQPFSHTSRTARLLTAASLVFLLLLRDGCSSCLHASAIQPHVALLTTHRFFLL